jgi:hypothetical protein
VYPFRVFISYSHEDRNLAQVAAATLEDMHLIPDWDQHIRPGASFAESIKALIHHAHIFMPLITRRSVRRPWVHQETGYAMALNIPILPIAVEGLAGEMVAQLQAVLVKSDLSDFRERLEEVNFEQVVAEPQFNPLHQVEVTSYPEERTEALARCAQRVFDLDKYGRVRQRAALSSFSIPDLSPGNPIWERRDGQVQRSEFYHKRQWDERQALERHARVEGCDLMIDPDFSLERNGPAARICRLEILLAFLHTMPDEKMRVVMTPRARGANLTIVGDWFSAESMSPRPGEGHRHTAFTWHAPSVLQTMRRFDKEFEELCRESPHGGSRLAAIARLEDVLEQETRP